jgi:ferric-dicitrate binding protein FerR (iron transport regulator)
MSDEFDDILHPDDRAELERIARMLESARPLPRPAFRGELARHLAAAPAAPASRRLRARVLSLGAAGVLLLAVAGLGVAHRGPLAPSRAAAAPIGSTAR